jgi:hypothetical protein
MSSERCQELASRCVPELDGLVERGTGDETTVGREDDVVD